MLTDVYLTPDEAAGRLGVRVRTIYRWIREGSLVAVNVGTTEHIVYRIDEAELNRTIAARRTVKGDE